MKKKHFEHSVLRRVYFLILGVGFVLSFGACKDNEKDGERVVEPEFISPSPKAETYDMQVASEWNELHLNLLKNNQSITSLSAARSLGYVNLALYESIVNGTENSSLVNKLRGFNFVPQANDSLEYNWGLAANVAQYTLIQSFFPKASATENAQIDALLSKYEKAFRTNSSQEVIKRSIEFGAAVANAVWGYARQDGLNGTDSLLFDKNYVFPSGLGVWEPSPSLIKPLLPQWKLLRPMIFSNKYLSATRIVPFSYRKESAFFDEANRVYEASKVITAIQEEKSKYWVGNELGNNAVRNIFGILSNSINSKDLKLDEASKLYLKGAILVYDGSIAVWRNKFETNLVRPDTYIKETLDKNWQPNLGSSYSPSFPSFAATLAGGIGKLIQDELGGSIQTPFAPTPITVADFKNEVVTAVVKSGTNFAMSAESGYKLGEQMMENTAAFEF